MNLSFSFLFTTSIIFILFVVVVIKNEFQNYDKIFHGKEINNIKKCFEITKRVTCLRNSNKLYIKKRIPHPHILFLDSYKHNYLDYPLIKNCVYLITIITEPDMFFERKVFRKIYRKYNYVSFVFVMGRSNLSCINEKIVKEINTYKDIIQFTYLASYFTLILQTYNILLWSFNLTTHFKWLIKHDTDTFFNIKTLYNLQSEYNNKYTLDIWGYVVKKFPSGMGYVIPKKSIKILINATKIDLYHNLYGVGEDVYIGKLAYRSNINLFDIRRLNKSIGKEGNCIINFIDNYIMIHRLKPIEIYFLHNLYFN